MFRRIQWRLLATYLVVILLALSFLGVHLTLDSEARYLSQVESGLLAQARLIARHVGPAVAAKDAARVQMELQGTQFPGDPAVVVVDRARRVLALHAADPALRVGSTFGRAGISSALEGKESTASARVDGVRVIYAATPVRAGARVIGAAYVALPLHELAAQIGHIRIVVAWTIVLTMMWAAVVSLLLAQRIAGPIQAMRAATARLAAGELSQRVPVRTNDELGDLARSFNYMATELERLDAMRREFVADASHELRTPVANLAVAVEALRAGLRPDDAPTVALVDAIDREVARLRHLVETLLDLSAIESGRVRLHMAPTDFSELAARVVESFRARAAGRGVELALDPASRPVRVLADPDRMLQVLGNLVDNALKFTPPGGRVTLTTGDHRGQAFVRVDDTGPGIAAKDLPHLFDRFFKADRSRSGQPGAGLGLAIAKRLMAIQGGDLTAENAPSGGARFVATLPPA